MAHYPIELPTIFSTSSSSSPVSAATIKPEIASFHPGANRRTSSREKHDRRLQRKAVKAKETRLRKKLYIESLEDKKARLQAKLAQLETGADTQFHNIDDVHRSEQDEVKKSLYEELNRDDINEDTIREKLSKFTENSRRRQNTAEYYISKVGECLVPEVQSIFMLWGLDHDDEEFFSNPNDVFMRVMVNHVGLTQEQVASHLEIRPEIRRLGAQLTELHSKLLALRKRVRSIMDSRHVHVDEAAKFLTPLQAARFCRWVDRNPLCMQMLDTVFEYNTTPE
eukprot:408672_1